MQARRTWILMIWALLLGLILAAIGQGCGPAESLNCPRLDGSQLYDPWCPVCAANAPPMGCDRCLVDMYLGPSFACYKDAGADAAITDAGATGCAGDCVPAPPFGWEGPGLLWVGPEGTAPACPSHAPVLAYQGHAGFVPSPAACTPCTCSPPTGGTCTPPLHFTASASSCAANGPPTRTFDPPPAWDGGCTAYDAVAAGDLCNGGPCVASLTSSPLVSTPGACTPSTAILGDAGAPSWKSAVRACRPAGDCNDQSLRCQPTAAQSAGFLTCIFRDGAQTCPASYPFPHLAFAGFDPPACAPCSCGAPDGTCTATLEVFADDACKTKPVLPQLDVDAGGPACGNLAAGTALGSKRLALVFDAGACAVGGGEAMDAGAVGASTFCCLMG